MPGEHIDEGSECIIVRHAQRAADGSRRAVCPEGVSVRYFCAPGGGSCPEPSSAAANACARAVQILITWIHVQPNLPVVPIDLSAGDAATPAERDRRNRFYERLGFTFDYRDDQRWGTSLPMISHDLRCVDVEPREEWELLDL